MTVVHPEAPRVPFLALLDPKCYQVLPWGGQEVPDITKLSMEPPAELAAIVRGASRSPQKTERGP